MLKQVYKQFKQVKVEQITHEDGSKEIRFLYYTERETPNGYRREQAGASRIHLDSVRAEFLLPLIQDVVIANGGRIKETQNNLT